MGIAKQKTIKTSLFLHLTVALLISLFLSSAICSIVDEAEQNLWLKYTENTQELYDFQNEYSEKFGELPPIPEVSYKKMSTTDAILGRVFDFLQSWSILLVSFGSVFWVLSHFYKKRLQKPLTILEESAKKIGEQDLDFYVDYEQEDEMGRLCKAFDKMRQQLKHNNQFMWKMIEEQKQMRAAFSHDLRTPLSVLKGYVEYLNRYYPEDRLSREKIMETLQELGQQTRRIENFADTMKEINHLDEQKINKEQVNKETILRKSEVILKTLAEKYGKQFEIQQMISQTPIRMDLDVYLEVLENLAENAMRYAKKIVRLELVDIESWLYMNLYDDGEGFSEEALRLALQPFYHGEEGENDHYGMGLYLCESLCKKHGGKISLGNQGIGGAMVKAQFYIK